MKQRSEHSQGLYSVANRSEAHSRFCERVHGRDLCQEGQADIACLDDILNLLELRPDDRVLDLGCGAGGIAEYVADRTEAIVTGVDYSASAIETANARTEGKRDRLTFVRTDFCSLEVADNSYDAAISIDSINFIAEKTEVISRFVRAVKPGGQLCIICVHIINEGENRGALGVDKTPVALALASLKLHYQAHDYTASLLKLWPLVKETAEALREDFIRDGAEFICETWLRDAEKTFLPAIEARRIKRYLYHVRV